MEIVAKLFGKLLVFLYHCFDRIVINGYLSGLSRPEQVMYLFRQVVGVRPPHGSHPARVREAIKACPTPRRRSDIARGWIGRQHSPSDTAIRKRAKANGWTRDLSGAVPSRVRKFGSREPARPGNAFRGRHRRCGDGTGVEVAGRSGGTSMRCARRRLRARHPRGRAVPGALGVITRARRPYRRGRCPLGLDPHGLVETSNE